MKEILLIEDTESDALLLERTLRTVGIANPVRRVATATDALLFLNAKERVLKSGDQSELSVILLDLKLPDKSGLDILALLQVRKTFSNTLKVVVSQLEDMEMIKRAYSLGADSFIVKPPHQQDIRELIRAFPEHWDLVDSTAPAAASSSQPQKPEPDPYKNAIHVWSEHRQLIDTLRANLQALKAQLADEDETLAILETLRDELKQQHPSRPTRDTLKH
jgi:two-component system response regulator